MKIGVLSDTHIPNAAPSLPQKLLEGLKGVDMIIHAGDLLELKVLDTLRKNCPNVVAVRGNMDWGEAGASLKEKEFIKAGKFKIGVTHGRGAPDKLVDLLSGMFAGENCDIIIFGHSHNPFNEKIGNTLYFNPGSPTDKVYSDFNSYGIIEIGEKIEAKIIRI